MNIKKLAMLVPAVTTLLVSGCAGHTYIKDVDYTNPVQGVHGVDRSRGTSSDALGIYHREIQKTSVTTTNSDGSTYTDRSSTYDHGFHLPFGGGGGCKSEPSSEFAIPSVPDIGYSDQPMVPPPTLAPPPIYSAPNPRPAVPQAPVSYAPQGTMYVNMRPVVYGIPQFTTICLPQQNFGYSQRRPWWKPCRR